MKAPQFGILFFTRRGARGKSRLAADAAVLVTDLRPACDLVAVLTSRPIFAGARRRQLVPSGQFLNLTALAEGSPADKQTLAQGAAV